uniref:Uncharacterized protein n=1 Tax=Tanacetum cinerariifolium TaxID=118510 RepID=A0A6L2MNT8_TANCI|nr:hypothetical protein [Tanacetum cinerariifolium]
MSTPVFVDPESSTQADKAHSSRVPVPLPEDPYEAIRQAYLVGTNIEFEPFDGKARTLESPYIVVPPTCHVGESEGSGTSDVRSTPSDSTVPLLPDHPLTHTTPVLVPILHRTARMAVRVSSVMSPGLSAGIAEVAAMFDLAFHKRFRSSYDSPPSLNFPIRKRYRDTSELILGTDSEEDEEIEESLDSDSVSKNAEDEGPNAEDEDLAAEDEGLAARVDGPGLDDKNYGLEDESHGVDGKSYGLDDESRGIDDEGYGIESDGLGLGKEEAIPEGQQRVVLVVGTAVSEPLGLGYRALRRRELALKEHHVYSTFEVGQVSGSAPEPERSERVSAFRQPTLTTWTDPEDASFIVPSPISSPRIPLTVPLPVASFTTAETEGFLTKLGARVEMIDLERFKANNDETFLYGSVIKVTSELVEDDEEEEDKEMEESLDSDSESEGADDEGLTVEDEGLAVGDEGLAAGDEGPYMRVESLGLGGDEAGVETLRDSVGEGRMPSIFEVGQSSRSLPETERPERVSALRQPILTTWIDPEDAPSIVPLPISSPMIPLTVPSRATSPAMAEIEGFLTELGA